MEKSVGVEVAAMCVMYEVGILEKLSIPDGIFRECSL
jgi:hypothetical protein